MRTAEVIAFYAMGLANGLNVEDYCVCPKAAYIVVSDGRRETIEMVHIPHEDLHSVGRVMEPSINELLSMVVNANPLGWSLGLSLDQRHLAISHDRD